MKNLPLDCWLCLSLLNFRKLLPFKLISKNYTSKHWYFYALCAFFLFCFFLSDTEGSQLPHYICLLWFESELQIDFSTLRITLYHDAFGKRKKHFTVVVLLFELDWTILDLQLHLARVITSFISLFFLINRLETLFENIQRISDTITLPYAMHSLRDRVSEKLDLTYFMEKLMQTKGETSFLATKERFELWEKVKVLSMPFKPRTYSQFLQVAP